MTGYCPVASGCVANYDFWMKSNAPPSRLKGFRPPYAVVAYTVWAYHRFALSTADVDDRLAERGVIVSRETVRLWGNRFGAQFAVRIRRDRPAPRDKWHMDEMAILARQSG